VSIVILSESGLIRKFNKMRGFNLVFIVGVLLGLIIIALCEEQNYNDINATSPNELSQTEQPSMLSYVANYLVGMMDQNTVNRLFFLAMGDNGCRSNSVCRAGRYLEQNSFKNYMLMALDYVVPERYGEDLQVFKTSAMYSPDCDVTYACQA